jgi:hypothetical protein
MSPFNCSNNPWPSTIMYTIAPMIYSNSIKSSCSFIAFPQNEEIYPGLMGLSSRNDIDQDDEFNDIQSRIRGLSNNFNGLSRYWPSPSFNDQQNARFFFNLANTGTTGINANNLNIPFFKTATFTLTSTLTLASIQSCVPSLQVSAAPVACRRKRSEIEDYTAEQYPITPSETLRQLLYTELYFDKHYLY